jgi:hypothetical protein
MGASIVLAIAITAIEVALALVYAHWPSATPTEHVVATTVFLEKAVPTPTPRPSPTPTPRPIPTPTPAPIVRATIAAAQRAAPAALRHAGGAGAAPTPMPHPIHTLRAAAPSAPGGSSLALAPGVGMGAGTGSGTGSDAGSGLGDGTGGSGTGEVNADTPCGYVEFIPSEPPRIVGNTSYETIQTTVHFPDGHTESEDFPYPWVYADYMDTDPWSPINVRKTNLVVFAQLPPPGADVQRYPEIVRYVLDHTKPNGGTVLAPCPH